MFSSLLVGKVAAELAKVDFGNGPMPPIEAAQAAIRDAAQLVTLGDDNWKWTALKAAYCLWRATRAPGEAADDEGDVIAHYADHCAGIAGKATELLRRLAALAWKEGPQGDALMRDVRAFLAARSG